MSNLNHGRLLPVCPPTGSDLADGRAEALRRCSHDAWRPESTSLNVVEASFPFVPIAMSQRTAQAATVRGWAGYRHSSEVRL
jgi:hypothetical protein